jgi:hypothetical protein
VSSFVGNKDNSTDKFPPAKEMLTEWIMLWIGLGFLFFPIISNYKDWPFSSVVVIAVFILIIVTCCRHKKKKASDPSQQQFIEWLYPGCFC